MYEGSLELSDKWGGGGGILEENFLHEGDIDISWSHRILTIFMKYSMHLKI